MQLVKPMLFQEAIDKIGARTPIGSQLTSAEWRDVPLALRERAFFSSTVESTRFLQRSRDFITDFLSGAREPAPSGGTMLRAGSRQEFVKQLQVFAIAEGMGPLDPKDAGTIKDITSQRRLELIFDTNTRAAQDYGNWKQGQDPDVLNEFPAQRFIRVIDVKEPRDWHTQFEGGVWLKSDLNAWIRINRDFGVPWGPWGWGCGHDVEDVDRDEAESLGLIRPGEAAAPAEKAFNERLEASARGLDADILQQLRNTFGSQIEIEGDAVRWRSDIAPAQPPPPAPAPQPPQPEPEPEEEAPTGVPVSDALNVHIPHTAHRERVEHAIHVIDSVHSDGILPPIEVGTTVSKKPGSVGTYFQGKNRIGVKRQGPHPEMTTAHEIGHMLDDLGIGKPGGFASETDPIMEKWRAAVDQSAAVAKLKELHAQFGSHAINYLLETRELFARSYAQYIAEKSGDAIMHQQLIGIREKFSPRQWSEEDFAPIRAALDELFQQLGWL